MNIHASYLILCKEYLILQGVQVDVKQAAQILQKTEIPLPTTQDISHP